MSPIEIEDIVGIAGTEYFVERVVADGYYVRSVDRPADLEFFDHAELQLTMAEGMLSVRSRRSFPSAKQSQTVLHRQAVCEALQSALATGRTSLSDRSLDKVIPSLMKSAAQAACGSSGSLPTDLAWITEIPIPKAATVRRWLRLYEETGCAILPFSLRRHHGDPSQEFEGKVASAFRRAVDRYAGVRDITMAQAYREFRHDLLSDSDESEHALDIPGVGTFRRVMLKTVGMKGLRNVHQPCGPSPSF